MDGRFLPWAHDHGKAYIGIEPVERYVTQARHTVEALQANAVMCCDGAENICAILTDHGIDPRVAMAFFPFNSIGNVSAIMPVVNALAQSDVGVCISTYQTTDLATDARRRYYERCGYEQLRCRTTQEGVCFEAIGGLCTWAYHVPYFISLAHDHGIVFTAIPFAGIGVVYFSKNLYPYEWRQ
ncbi:MAG TPA: hypothetical protein DCY49_03225 [Candidatus Jacksonbacteria bacterium]|nr:hypothetical protein [Candidatus Jacksonbacteria bacterium]